ncbi:hypothetical protein NpNSSI1_00005248, partial [Neofusicoccum parvum]
MPPAIEIDLTETNVDTTKPGEIRAQLQAALEAQETTKDIRCCGLIRNPGNSAK